MQAIELLSYAILLALICQGIWQLTRKDGILGIWQSLPFSKGHSISKPISECPQCMSSFWSVAFFLVNGWMTLDVVVFFFFTGLLLLLDLFTPYYIPDKAKITKAWYRFLELLYLFIFVIAVLVHGNNPIILVIPLAACGMNDLLERIIEALEAP